MIAPGNLNTVIKIIVHMFKGIFIFIKEPKRLIAKSNTSAIKSDLINHFKNFLIILTHIIIWDNVYLYYYFKNLR